jgi:hypothetical protein
MVLCLTIRGSVRVSITATDGGFEVRIEPPPRKG